MTPPSIEKAIQAIHQLPNMPGTVQQVLGYLNDVHVDQNRMEQAIARDSALVARLLRVANSPFYGLTNQVQTIHDAVVVIGLSNLRMIVMTTMLTTLKIPASADKTQMNALFRHSIAVAICARVLARRVKANPDQAFLTGILHDIGKLALMSTYSDIYVSVLALERDKGIFSVDAERQVFGFDHSAIGAALCHHWHLPPHICGAISIHHGPPDNIEEMSLTETDDPLAQLLHIANFLAHALDPDVDGSMTMPSALVLAKCPVLNHQEQLANEFIEISKMYKQFVSLVA